MTFRLQKFMYFFFQNKNKECMKIKLKYLITKRVKKRTTKIIGNKIEKNERNPFKLSYIF